MFASSLKRFSSLLTSKQILEGIRTLPVSERASLVVAIRAATPHFSAKEVRIIFHSLIESQIHDLSTLEDLIAHLPLRISQCSFHTIAGLMESVVIVREKRPKSQQVLNFVKNSTQLLGDIFLTLVDQTKANIDECEYLAQCQRIKKTLAELPSGAFSQDAMTVLDKVLALKRCDR